MCGCVHTCVVWMCVQVSGYVGEYVVSARVCRCACTVWCNCAYVHRCVLVCARVGVLQVCVHIVGMGVYMGMCVGTGVLWVCARVVCSPVCPGVCTDVCACTGALQVCMRVVCMCVWMGTCVCTGICVHVYFMHTCVPVQVTT